MAQQISMYTSQVWPMIDYTIAHEDYVYEYDEYTASFIQKPAPSPAPLSESEQEFYEQWA